MARDWCNEKDPTNKHVLDFIRAHLDELQSFADELRIPVEWLLGLSGTECDYGSSNIARQAKNFFGLTKGASGNIGYFATSKGVKVAKFKNFKASAQSFVTDFGRLVFGKKTSQDFVNALVPKFNSADSRTNGNPTFREDTLEGIKAISHRMSCIQMQPSAHKCGARCKDFDEYGYCDRLTKSKRCWQHTRKLRSV